jgi:hypothetical protein
MTDFIKQKQVENLVSDLSLKAVDSEVVKKSNNLNDVDASSARTNLDVHSKAEVNNLISGADHARSVADTAGRELLTDLNVGDRVFVADDGDGKWAIYLVTAITDGQGTSSTYEKIADEDLFSNAISADAVKAAYESNTDTNAYTDAEKATVGHISVSQEVDLDAMETAIGQNATDVATAQTSANNAANAANAAQSTADLKEDEFTETKESFTGLNSPENTPVPLNLANPVKSGHQVIVFFEGLMVSTVSFTPGSQNITFTVPYPTVETDKVTVIYKH